MEPMGSDNSWVPRLQRHSKDDPKPAMPNEPYSTQTPKLLLAKVVLAAAAILATRAWHKHQPLRSFGSLQ